MKLVKLWYQVDEQPLGYRLLKVYSLACFLEFLPEVHQRAVVFVQFVEDFAPTCFVGKVVSVVKSVDKFFTILKVSFVGQEQFW